MAGAMAQGMATPSKNGATPPSIMSPPEDLKQRYCLKWNNYQSNVTTTFKELLAVEDFVDITLSAEGGALRAHKVVLSACSPYFRDILKGISSWQHPVIVLKDVPYEDLQGIVEFIYHGEVSVDKECLPSFLKTAQTLRVKGLTDETSSSLKSSNTSVATAAQSGISAGRSHSRKSSKPKRSLPFAANSELASIKKAHLDELIPKVIKNEEEEEIDDVEDDLEPREEAEPKAATIVQEGVEDEEEEIHDDEEEEEEEEVGHPGTGPIGTLSSTFFAGLSPSFTNAALALAANAANTTLTKSNLDLDVDDRKQRQPLIGGAGEFDPELFAKGLQDFGGCLPPPLKNMMNINGSNLDNIQISQASSSSTAPGSGPGSLSQKKTCPYCYQQLSWHALSRHIRDMHKAKTNFVTCKFCQKMFRNKNSLGCHMWRFHKEAKDKDIAGHKDISNKDHLDVLKGMEKEEQVKANSTSAAME